MNNSSEKPRLESLYIYLLVLVLYLLLLPIVIASPIGSSSEAREVHVAKIIHDSGEWIAPRRVGFAPSKPPLYHWIVAGIGSIFGYVDEKIARGVSLFFGMMVLALTMRLAIALAPKDRLQRVSKSKMAVLSGIILLTTYQFLRLCGDTRVDMTFSYFVVSAIAALLWPVARSINSATTLNVEYNAKDLNAFYVAAALAVLAKGPLGLVLPLAIGFAIVVVQLGVFPGIKLFLKPRLGWLLFILIASPWYIMSATKGGEDFIARQIIFENLQRFSGGENISREPIWFYLPSFIINSFPWGILFFIFIISLFTKLGDKINPPYPSFNRGILIRLGIALWVIIGVFLFSLSAGKRDSYLLPLFPALAIFLTWELHIWYESLSDKWRYKIANYVWRFYCLVISLSFFLLGLIFLIPIVDFTFSPTISHLISWIVNSNAYFAGPLLLIICVALVAFNRRERYSSMKGYLFTLPVISVFCGVLVFIPMAIRNELKGFHRMAIDINARMSDRSEVYVVRTRQEELLDPLLFYLNKETSVLIPPVRDLNCGNYYLFQIKYLDQIREVSQNTGKKIEIKGHYQQLVDKQKNYSERDIFLAYSDCED